MMLLNKNQDLNEEIAELRPLAQRASDAEEKMQEVQAEFDKLQEQYDNVIKVFFNTIHLSLVNITLHMSMI